MEQDFINKLKRQVRMLEEHPEDIVELFIQKLLYLKKRGFNISYPKIPVSLNEVLATRTIGGHTYVVKFDGYSPYLHLQVYYRPNVDKMEFEQIHNLYSESERSDDIDSIVDFKSKIIKLLPKKKNVRCYKVKLTDTLKSNFVENSSGLFLYHPDYDLTSTITWYVSSQISDTEYILSSSQVGQCYDKSVKRIKQNDVMNEIVIKFGSYNGRTMFSQPIDNKVKILKVERVPY